MAPSLVAWSSCALADDEGSARWQGPFGGTFSASLSVVSDYTFAGISQTQRRPAVQPEFVYRTPSFATAVDLRAYVGAWGSNIDFPATGPGVEIDVMGGFELQAFERRLSVDIGYVRYTYPGTPASLGYDYGDVVATVGWDFGPFAVSGRIRYSPDSFGASGAAWNKRAHVAVPMPFLRVNENISFQAYGTIGNQWVDGYINYGLPGHEYWYWQTGLVVSAYGFDVTLAYTDTNIGIAGCGYSTNCQGRIIVGLARSF